MSRFVKFFHTFFFKFIHLIRNHSAATRSCRYITRYVFVEALKLELFHKIRYGFYGHCWVSSRLHVLPHVRILICHVVIILEPGG